MTRMTRLRFGGLFEILTFGDLGRLVKHLKHELRIRISEEIGLDTSDDRAGRLLQDYIFLIKDLRNAIAHDSVVYDGRYIKNPGLNNKCIDYIENVTSIRGINFTTFEDTLILICYFLKLFGVPKRQIKTLVNNYISVTTSFVSEMNDSSLTDRQIRADTLSKARKILLFL